MNLSRKILAVCLSLSLPATAYPTTRGAGPVAHDSDQTALIGSQAIVAALQQVDHVTVWSFIRHEESQLASQTLTQAMGNPELTWPLVATLALFTGLVSWIGYLLAMRVLWLNHESLPSEEAFKIVNPYIRLTQNHLARNGRRIDLPQDVLHEIADVIAGNKPVSEWHPTVEAKELTWETSKIFYGHFVQLIEDSGVMQTIVEAVPSIQPEVFSRALAKNLQIKDLVNGEWRMAPFLRALIEFLGDRINKVNVRRHSIRIDLKGSPSALLLSQKSEFRWEISTVEVRRNWEVETDAFKSPAEIRAERLRPLHRRLNKGVIISTPWQRLRYGDPIWEESFLFSELPNKRPLFQSPDRFFWGEGHISMVGDVIDAMHLQTYLKIFLSNKPLMLIVHGLDGERAVFSLISPKDANSDQVFRIFQKVDDRGTVSLRVRAFSEGIHERIIEFEAASSSSRPAKREKKLERTANFDKYVVAERIVSVLWFLCTVVWFLLKWGFFLAVLSGILYGLIKIFHSELPRPALPSLFLHLSAMIPFGWTKLKTAPVPKVLLSVFLERSSTKTAGKLLEFLVANATGQEPDFEIKIGRQRDRLQGIGIKRIVEAGLLSKSCEVVAIGPDGKAIVLKSDDVLHPNQPYFIADPAARWEKREKPVSEKVTFYFLKIFVFASVSAHLLQTAS